MKMIKQVTVFLGLLSGVVSLYGAQKCLPGRPAQTYVIIQGTTRRGKEMLFLAENKQKNLFFLRAARGQTKEDLVKSMNVSLADGHFLPPSTNGHGDRLYVFDVGKTRINAQSPSEKIRMRWFNKDHEDNGILSNVESAVTSGLGFEAHGGFSACDTELFYKVFCPDGYGSDGATDGSVGASCLNPRPWQHAKK